MIPQGLRALRPRGAIPPLRSKRVRFGAPSGQKQDRSCGRRRLWRCLKAPAPRSYEAMLGQGHPAPSAAAPRGVGTSRPRRAPPEGSVGAPTPPTRNRRRCNSREARRGSRTLSLHCSLCVCVRARARAHVCVCV